MRIRENLRQVIKEVRRSYIEKTLRPWPQLVLSFTLLLPLLLAKYVYALLLYLVFDKEEASRFLDSTPI